MKTNFLLLLTIAALAGSAAAAPISINFTTNNPSSTFVSGGLTVTPTAWGVTGNNGTTFQAGTLGRFSLGLGVCNANEGANCSSPEHQVDNNGNLDFVLFAFSAPVNSISFTVTPAGNYDTDVTYYSRTASSAFNLSGQTLSNLTGLGFTMGGDNITTTGVAHSFTITGTGITSVLLGARVGNTDGLDYFKITSMSGTTPDASAVPEPSTLGMLGFALVGLGALRRRTGAKK